LSNLKIITIANEVGFEDVSNINKTFKKIEGISPREYRQQAALIIWNYELFIIAAYPRLLDHVPLGKRRFKLGPLLIEIT
jgi:AraC-like DNA-binding protein